ncbi:MFS transporter [Usitatibacter palustris]|uniref:Multidrug resistance protein MdtG n=1 Tax=Usitatibacter palustris TaxID=2732487 RepID=A0A6M4HEX0_9PROT|nr:MFS transporter [Usitatibacter palustris]QJR16577.1 Multidrug resistance protein MdtG [Usitatibacter palustris]
MTHHSPFRRASLYAFGAIALVLGTAIVACTAIAYGAFERELRPEAMRKAETVGRGIDALVAKTVRWQVPLAKLPGLDALFEGIQKDHPEISWVAIKSEGKIIVSRGDASVAKNSDNMVQLPLITADEPATLEIGVDPAWVARIFREMLLDMAVILVVALVISLELALYLAGGGVLRSLAVLAHSVRSAGAGNFAIVRTARADGEVHAMLASLARAVDTLQQRCLTIGAAKLAEAGTKFHWPTQPVPSVGRVNTSNILGAMRAPFFLSLFADDLQRSFLPLFAGTMSTGPFDVSVNLVVGLPITIFMLVVALSQPVLGSWTERIGRRRAFLAGAALGMISHLLCAQATTLVELLVFRGAAGLGWAVTFVAAQGYVIDNTDRETRTRGLAVFVGIIMTASICGPSIGGILADGLGPRWTFVIGGVLGLFATLLAWRDLPDARQAAKLVAPPRMRDYAAALANPRFAILLAFAAIPAKVILIGYVFYLLPLFVADAGYSAAMSGRIIMLYSVMMVLLIPVTTELLERIQQSRGVRPQAAFVAGGLALSGLAGLLMLLPLGMAGAVALTVLLGIAQAFSIAPQSSMVGDVSAAHKHLVSESTIYGVYRLVERLGNAAGPLIAAFLLQVSGFETAFASIGLAVLICSAMFYVSFRGSMRAAAP